MSMIQTFNKAVSKAINQDGEFYEALIGDEQFIPESTIAESSDFNCGGLCNELEYLRKVSEYYTQSFDLDIAEDENLEALVTSFIDLPRRNRAEGDDIYRKRYRSIANAKTNNRRITKWAIIDAIREFGLDPNGIQIIEKFDSTALYFEVRIEGAIDYTSSIFVNSLDSGFIGANFIGGSGVGYIITFLGDIIDRIKAAGVDFDILFIIQDRFTVPVDAFIGRVQMYINIDSHIKASSSVISTIDATII